MGKELRLVIGISGASGIPYAVDFLRRLAYDIPGESSLIVSDAALTVCRYEAGFSPAGVEEFLAECLNSSAAGKKQVHKFNIYNNSAFYAPPASGSVFYDGMVIVPCSMNTISSIAHGAASSLMTRAADVCLKERRRLVVVPRESPYSLTHLKNMTAITEAGGIVLPASPAFYHSPRTIEDLTGFLSARILSLFGIPLPPELCWRPEE